jgi:hypothetical protein
MAYWVATSGFALLATTNAGFFSSLLARKIHGRRRM